jgi:Cytochrome P460
MRYLFAIPVLLAGFSAVTFSAIENDPPAPTNDRVGFPIDYRQTFTVLRRVNRPEKQQVVTVYGNKLAATIKRPGDLPYPYGSTIVMETAGAKTDTKGKALLDAEGYYRKDQVAGLHVMRREKGFGAAYGKNRTGEWEYVEYRADQSYITPPQKSFACAECHLKAGRERDFVYRGRLPADGEK